MTIRLMTASDYDDALELWQNTPGMGLNEQDDSRDGITRYLARNPSTCFVTTEGGRLIGVILSGHDGRRGYIYHTAVALAYRGQGLGREMVRRALEALEKEGIHKAALLAFRRNETGNAFWQKRGFGERTDVCYRDRLLDKPNKE